MSKVVAIMSMSLDPHPRVVLPHTLSRPAVRGERQRGQPLWLPGVRGLLAGRDRTGVRGTHDGFDRLLASLSQRESVDVELLKIGDAVSSLGGLRMV